ncbi:MAG TPA: thioredoxin TrxC [Hyphomicrobiales bacterium]|jgi:thioredoxin 2
MSKTRQIVCGACGRINRVPAERPAEAARCGACHKPLFTAHPVEVGEAGFERHLAHDGIPILVDVWAPWCGPCRTMGPMFERAAASLEPEVRLLKLNADEVPGASARFGIRSIPTLLLLRDGQLIARNSGVMNASQIVDWTRSHLH